MSRQYLIKRHVTVEITRNKETILISTIEIKILYSCFIVSSTMNKKNILNCTETLKIKHNS
jgi:hypothetical protein